MKAITQRISALIRVLLVAALLLGLGLLPRLPAASRAAVAPRALLEETPTPGHLGMSRALSLSNTMPRAGEVVTATFAVQNVGGQALMEAGAPRGVAEAFAAASEALQRALGITGPVHMPWGSPSHTGGDAR